MSKKIIFIILIVVILNIFLQIRYLNSGWDKLITRCPVFYAIEARNIARFGIRNINKSNLYAVGNYGLKREFDVPMCNHPLFTSLICALFFKVFGVSVWITKLLAILFGIAIIILLILLTRRIFKKELLVFITGVVGSIIPLSFYYSHELDRWWLDIFYLLSIILFYHKAFENNFMNVWSKMGLYFFTLLGCFNGWRLIAIIPLLILHCIFFTKNMKVENKKSAYKFLREYALLFILIAICLIWYISHLHSTNFITYVKNIYPKTEPILKHFSLFNWLFKYFLIQRNCYTSIIYLAYFLGLWLFFTSKKIKMSDKFLMGCLIFWGIITTLFLTNHAYYEYCLHNAFYIPVILLSSFSIITSVDLIPHEKINIKFSIITIFFVIFIIHSNLTFAKWPFRYFTVKEFEIKINRNTNPNDIIATNVDLTGQHDYSTDIRNPINLHNMFYMDREIEIFKSIEDFLKSDKRYKYFVFENNELSLLDTEKELFYYLRKNYPAKLEKERKFYIFWLKND